MIEIAELTPRQKTLRNYLEVLLSELVFCDFLDREAFKFPKSEKEIQEIVENVIFVDPKSIFDDYKSYPQEICFIFEFGPSTYILFGTDGLYVKVNGTWTQICSIRKFDEFSLHIGIDEFLESGSNCYGHCGNDYIMYSKDKMLSLLRKQYINLW